VVERQKAAIELFVLHQQFAKAVEPTVRHFDNPASCLLFGTALEFIGFLSSAFDVRDVAMLLDDFQRGRSGIARVSAAFTFLVVSSVTSYAFVFAIFTPRAGIAHGKPLSFIYG